MFSGEVYPAQVDILDGIIVRVRTDNECPALPSERIFNGGGRYLIPGFIDSHLHVESTMMVPENFGRAVLPWGTTTIVMDPHEDVYKRQALKAPDGVYTLAIQSLSYGEEDAAACADMLIDGINREIETATAR